MKWVKCRVRKVLLVYKVVYYGYKGIRKAMTEAASGGVL